MCRNGPSLPRKCGPPAQFSMRRVRRAAAQIFKRREVGIMLDANVETDLAFAAALRANTQPVPAGLQAESAHRFAVYRNNSAVAAIEALEARFPSVRAA